MKQVALLYTLASPALVSYSIEFSSFPEFADILLDNIARIIGHKPYIRVGGNTQDYALYDASLPYALNGTFDPARSEDYPTTITIGPSYFEAYNTWKDVKYYHGFNLGLGGNRSSGWQTLLDTVPLACRALSGGKLYVWGYGNEPDLYSTSAQGPVRPSDWSEDAYVSQWHNGTRQIKALIEEHCPEMADEDSYGYMAPSFAGVGNHLKAEAAWAAGLNDDKNVKLFSTHNYISGAETPGVTLQGTLMNHAVTKRSVDAHIEEYNKMLSQSTDPVPPLIFGETNSLYNQGRPGLSNTFGAALWGLDFNLYAASVGFKRVHMHMGTNYRYAAWQPIPTTLTTIGTKAPYYGSIAVAAALGPTPATVVEIPLTTTTPNPSSPNLTPESAYAIYTAHGTHLTRLIILNLHTHNTTVDGAGLTPLPHPPTTPRNTTEYTFRLPSSSFPEGTLVGVRRLMANGSDAITGISWDGWSYNYELDGGRPARLGNVTVGETVVVGEGGVVRVGVPDASAVVVDLDLDLGLGLGLDLGLGLGLDGGVGEGGGGM
ncbi:uncharacterized protein B0H64DRAFT_314456 [Chaetomium fimeti]|uniref:Beta-glucuronidase C-terminal domain-containing protein n=1 Tax=Chaetomium fimeti TaxID=1854472 RepID=A0AAE0LWA5_9PEZI|nr:hypothetical protein B0H64DRAFT_314456 [Chaetomium fimeti]